MTAEVHRRDGEVNLPNIISSTPCSHQKAIEDMYFLIGLTASRQKKLLEKSRIHFSQLSKSVKELADAVRSHPYGFRSVWCLQERRERALQGVVDVVESADAMRHCLVSGKNVRLPRGRPQKMNCRYMYRKDESMVNMEILPDSDTLLFSVYQNLRKIKTAISPVHRVKTSGRYFYRDVTKRTSTAYAALVEIAEAAQNIGTVLESNESWNELDISWILLTEMWRDR